jgi:beta-glucanase (GH16 family)
MAPRETAAVRPADSTASSAATAAIIKSAGWIVLCSLQFAGCGTVAPEVADPVPADDSWTLAWSDEFDGDALDTAVWERQVGDGTAYDLPPGWGNAELQLYDGSESNSFVADGLLHIVARRSDDGGVTSARLRTQDRREVLYGRIEARIKVPAAPGMWPAFWMLPTNSRYGTWAACGEIDIMETINFAETLYGTIHFGGPWPDNTKAGGQRRFEAGELSAAFHVYGVEWTPDEIRWFVDGEEYNRLTSDDWYTTGAPDNPRAPFDQPLHLILNLAVGGHWPGAPDDETVFPQTMLVDWVRVWQNEALPSPAPPATVDGDKDGR